jgi:trimeric autotransporter adhesin
MVRFLFFRLNWSVCLFVIALVALLIPASALDLGNTGYGTTTAGTISNGDPVTLHGIATGHPRNGLQVWVISKNYLKMSTIQVNNDNTFEFELRSSDTRNLASGQYFVVVQHPMMNGEFDVYYNSASGSVINRQLGVGGTKIFQMSGSGSLQGPDSAQALVSAISSQNIDDSFTTYTFTINPPAAFIDPIGDHAIGDRFTIQGSTNLAVGDNLMVDITSSSFKPTQKTGSGEFSGANGMVTVIPGSGGLNRWSFDVDASAFKADEYIVKVSGVTIDVTGSTTFNIAERPPTTPATPVSTAVVTASLPTTTPMPQPPAPTPTKSSLPLGITVIGLAVTLLAKGAGW